VLGHDYLVITNVAAYLAPLVVMSRPWIDLTEPDQIDLGDDAFGRRFTVFCEEPSFAQTILDDPMRRWLGGSEGHVWFETRGHEVLIVKTASGRPATEIPEALELLIAFCARIPGTDVTDPFDDPGGSPTG